MRAMSGMNDSDLTPAPSGWYRLARQVGGAHWLDEVRQERPDGGYLVLWAHHPSPCGRIMAGAIVYPVGDKPARICDICAAAPHG